MTRLPLLVVRNLDGAATDEFAFAIAQSAASEPAFEKSIKNLFQNDGFVIS